MRRIRAALAAAAVTVAASGLLAGPPRRPRTTPGDPTATACTGAYKDDGYFRAYDAVDCYELLGADQGNDLNWADGAGAFRGSDNDKATSLLNTGTYAGGINNLQIYEAADGGVGGVGCLSRGELYVDDLRDNTFSNDHPANNKVSRHIWSGVCTNPWS